MNMFNLKLVSLLSGTVGFISLFAAAQASAITFYTKPDFPVNSAEFGHAIAKKGKYIVVGADRHAEFGRGSFTPNDWGTQRNADNGAIYLLTEDYSEPVKKYQFFKDPSVAPTNENGMYLAMPLNFGSQVAISDNWIAATIPRHGLAMTPAIALIPKTANGTFPTCPSAPYITGLAGAPSTQKNWGNAVNCASEIDVQGGVSKPIRVFTLPASFTSNLGRTLTLKLSDNALALSDGNQVITARRAMPYGDWQAAMTFTAEPGKRITDIALNGQLLAIGVSPASTSAAYNDAAGTVHTFKLDSNAGTAMGVLTTGFVGFGRQLAMNDDILMIAAGGLLYPQEMLAANPGLALSSPVPKGYVFQYKLDASGNSWSGRGYAEYSSTPTALRLDNTALAVQLQEMGMTELGSGTGYSPSYNPHAVAKVFFRSNSGEKLFDHGNGNGYNNGKTISKNQIDSARPWYAYVGTPNQFSAGFPIDIANGSIVFGWKSVRGDNSEVYALNGGIFHLKLNEIW
jgi:hypothetical protein